MFSFRTLLFLPARCHISIPTALVDEEEKELPLDMWGNGAPSLLVTVYGFERHTQQFRQLFLCLSEFFPG